MDMNDVTLLGNVGQDPEVFTTKGGMEIVKVSLATNRQWTTKDGEKKKETQWHRVTFMNANLGQIVSKFVKKGDRILVKGRIEYGKYTDKEGVERYSVDIIVPPYEGFLSLEGGGNGKRRGDNVGQKAQEEEEDLPW